MANILIADDAELMRLMIRQILIENGHIILGEAHDGEEAVKLYKQLKPDLITVDISMPKMTGLEAIRKIIELDPLARIVVVTALGQQSVALEAVKAGARNIVIKPFKHDDLLTVVSKTLTL